MGCQSLTKLQVPADLTTACPDLEKFKGRTMGDLMGYTIDLQEQYRLCQTRQMALVKAVK